MIKANFQLPFNGSWLTFWGGDSAEQNIHYDTACQKYAYDFVQTTQDGKFFRTNGKTNDDYFSFGQDILSPAEGTIFEVVVGVRDNQPGELHSYAVLGNYIIIQHDDRLFSVLAHFKQNSIKVEVGQRVSLGERLGACGNSGYSSSAHIHYHVQDSAIFAKFNNKFEKVNVALGQKISFDSVNLNINKVEKVISDYSPIKGDIVSNVN